MDCIADSASRLVEMRGLQQKENGGLATRPCVVLYDSFDAVLWA